MITIQDTIYMGTAAPASGGGGSGDAVWGAITGTLSDQTDLQTALNAKQNTLTAGSGITINNGTISATGVESVANQNTNVGAINSLKVWNGTEQEWNNGGSQTWYGWDSISPLGTTTYYLESSSPQVGDVVYSAPNVATTGTVQTIMGSTMVSTTNGLVLQYNASHNQTAQGNLGREHPDWLFNIDGVGVKLGTTDIANYITYTAGNNVSINNGVISATNTTYTAGNNISISNNVISATNTTYSPFTGATSQAAGSAGLVPRPTTADVGKYLKGDGTWASLSVSEITNQNTNVGAINSLKIWNGTEQEWNNGGSQTWYCWDEFQGGVGVVGTWYTLDDPENITTETVLYSAPNVVDTSVTVTYGGYRSFSASNGHTGMYNSSGNQTTTSSVGESHPDWLCNIDGVGVKIGTTNVANLASYSAFTGATSQAAGSTGLVPAPTTGDVDKYLKGDGTWAAVSGGGGLQNTATGTDSLTILGTPATDDYCINIGANSQAVLSGYDGSVAIGINAYAIGGGIAIGSYDDEGYYYAAAYNNSVAIGLNAKAGSSNVSGAIAIGYARAQGNNSIAIGNDTSVYSANSIGIGNIYIESSALNNIAIGSLSNVSGGSGMLSGTNYSISIGFENSVTGTGSIVLGSLISVPDHHKFVVSGWNNSQQEHFNINLLDLQTGKIPNDRINGATGSFTSQDGKTVTVTNGVITSIV